MSVGEPSELLTLAVAAARAGAVELNARFGKIAEHQIDRKGPSDFVSEADRASEAAIAAVLETANQGFGFQGEESGLIAGADGAPRWVVDPLDGTTNFLWELPYISISIALVDDEGVRLGVVHDPLRGEMFTAERGRGAWRNGEPLIGRTRASGEKVLSMSLPALFNFRDIEGDRYMVALKAIMAEASGIRRMGSAALDLAYVAAGRLDGMVDDGIKLHDYAAGMCIVREAGGIVTDFVGQDPTAGAVVAAMPTVHAWLLDQYRIVQQGD
jgi:myo-inositol-1(or 4)-monophosphatase